jgi:predicted SprT family Zn-dependent metalloprotease
MNPVLWPECKVVALQALTDLQLPAPAPKLALAHMPEEGEVIILPPPPPEDTPNTKVSKQLDEAYRFYNKALFDGKLADAYFHLHRKRNALGYFWEARSSGITVDGKAVHEIALDPDKLNRTLEENLSTIVHEMVHFWQQDHGKVSRATHHNKEWANKMESIGLMPSSTGRPGGKRTGMRVSHYTIKGGKFDEATKELLARGYRLAVNGTPKRGRLTKPYRTTWKCPECNDTALAKHTIKLICGKCNVSLVDKYPR